MKNIPVFTIFFWNEQNKFTLFGMEKKKKEETNVTSRRVKVVTFSPSTTLKGWKCLTTFYVERIQPCWKRSRLPCFKTFILVYEKTERIQISSSLCYKTLFNLCCHQTALKTRRTGHDTKTGRASWPCLHSNIKKSCHFCFALHSWHWRLLLHRIVCNLLDVLRLYLVVLFGNEIRCKKNRFFRVLEIVFISSRIFPSRCYREYRANHFSPACVIFVWIFIYSFWTEVKKERRRRRDLRQCVGC